MRSAGNRTGKTEADDHRRRFFVYNGDVPDTQVRHVLFYVPLKPGNLMLAEMDSGNICILRNDHPLNFCWKQDEMTAAIETFQKMKAELVAGKTDPSN